MEFFVVGPDGNKFGPASLETLNKWAAEGRVVATTILERASDGVRGPASLLPGLTIPASSTPAAPGTPDATAPGTPASATPGTPDPAAPGTPDAPSTAGQPSRAQFKEVETPASAGQRMSAPSYGPGSTPDQPGAYPGYPRQTSYRYDVVPPELTGKFNWGAFFLTWIWGLNHRAYITLLSIGYWALMVAINVAVVGVSFNNSPGASAAAGRSPAGSAISWIYMLGALGLRIWWGIKGYEWAWMSARFQNPDQCKRCQATWGWWGFGLFVLVCGCGLVLMATVFAAAFAAVRGMSAH